VSEARAPTFCIFTLTEVDGGKFYGAALTYHRKLSASSKAALGVAHGGASLSEPTCVCLLSHVPLFGVLRALLREVYWCVHSRAAHVPIERLVERLLFDLPLPAPHSGIRVRVRAALWPDGSAGYGRAPVFAVTKQWESREQLVANTALKLGDDAAASACVNDGIYYVRPAPTHFPLCDFPLRTLFDCLGVSTVVRLVAALLCESKMVVLSKQQSLLTVACETLTALLYPFQWPYVCLPILPRSLVDLMQAPTPYLLGMHPSVLDHVNSEIDVTDVIVVNLDNGDVRGPVPSTLPRVLTDIITEKLIAALYPKVSNFDLAFSVVAGDFDQPKAAAAAPAATAAAAPAASVLGKTLSVSTLTAIDSSRSSDNSASDTESSDSATESNAREKEQSAAAVAATAAVQAAADAAADAAAEAANVAASQNLSRADHSKADFERMYAATFDAAKSPTLGQAQREDGVDRRVQAVFLSLFVTLLHDYHAYIQYVRRFPTPIAVFNKAAFVRDNGITARFLATLVDTQAFAVFLEERHAVADNLFDIAVRRAHQLMQVDAVKARPTADGSAPATGSQLTMYRAALSLPDLMMRLDNDILSLPCLASDVTETFVVPGPDCHDFGSASVFDYAAPDSPAFPQFDPNRFSARATAPLAEASAMSYLLLDGEAAAAAARRAVPINAALTLYTRIAPALLRRAMSVELAEAAAAATMEWNGLLAQSMRLDESSSGKSKRRQISTATLSREGFIAAGDAAESFMDAFFGSLFESKPLDHEELVLLHRILKLELERANFLDRLQAHKQRLSGEAPLELTDSSFELLADILRRALQEARLVADFQTPLVVLAIGAAFYRVREGPEFLWAVLQRLPVWRNTYFWEYAVFAQIERSKLSVIPAELHAEARSWDDLPSDLRSLAVRAEQDVVCNVLTEYTQHMLHMGVGGLRARAIVSQMCSLAALTSSQRDMLLALIDNIERVMEADKMTRATLRRDPSGSDRANDAAGDDGAEESGVLALGDVVDVLSDGGARRRLGGEHHSPAANDTAEAKQLYARLIALQRKGRHGKDAGRPGSSGAAGAGADGASGAVGLSGFGAPAAASARRNMPPQASMEQFKTHQVTTLKGHAAGVECIALSATRVASGAKDGSLQLWQVDSGVPDATLRGHTDRISALAFLDADELVSGSYDKTLRVWNTAVASERLKLEGHTGSICAVDVHPDKRQVLSGSYDHSLKLWDVRKGGSAIATMSEHSGPIIACQFDRKANFVVSSSRDNTLKVWDMRKRNRCLFTLQDHRDWVKCFQFDSKRLVSGSYDHTVKVWDMKTGRCTRTLTGHTGAVTCVRYDSDAASLISASADRTLRMWSLKTGDCLRTYDGHAGEVSTVAFADDRMYSGSKDGGVCAWSLDDASLTIKPLFSLAGHTDAVVVLQALPTADVDAVSGGDVRRQSASYGRIVSGSADGTCKLWRFLGEKNAPSGEPAAGALSPTSSAKGTKAKASARPTFV
jgi:WD40 repeat protein